MFEPADHYILFENCRLLQGKGVYSRIFALLLQLVFRWVDANTKDKMGLLAINIERIRGELLHSNVFILFVTTTLPRHFICEALIELRIIKQLKKSKSI